MIKLTLTDEQAKICSAACELYARLRMGQFNELIWRFLDMGLPTDEFCERRDAAETALLEARRQIYPELYGIGHSYGVGHFEDADMAYDIYQALRPFFGDKRAPFSYNVIPEAERVKGETAAEWIPDDYEYYRCSNCGYEHDEREKVTPFCPNCGKKMEDEDE